MDINDPRYRLRVLNQSNPSIRVATSPQINIAQPKNNGPQISIAPPRPSPNISVGGQPVKQQGPINSSWSTPKPPSGGFFKTIKNIGSSIARPFTFLGKGLANVPQAVYREAQNKPIYDIQKKTFGTDDPKKIIKDIATNTAMAGLTVGLPGAGAETGLATRAALDAGIGAGYGTAQAIQENKKPMDVVKTAGVTGLLGGAAAPILKGVAAVLPKSTGSIVKKVTRANTPEAVQKVLKGVDDNTAHFLAGESNPETIHAVIQQLDQNNQFSHWMPGKTSQPDLNKNNQEIKPGMFDAENPPQEVLPPGFHAPNAPDPGKLLPERATPPAVVEGKGFKMTAEANQKAIEAGKRIAQIDKKLTNVQQGKITLPREEAVGLMAEKKALVEHVNSTLPEEDVAAIKAAGGKTSESVAEPTKPVEATPTQEQVAAQVSEQSGSSGTSAVSTGDLPAEDVKAIQDAGGDVNAAITHIKEQLDSAQGSYDAAAKTRSGEKAQRAAAGANAYDSAGGGEAGFKAKLAQHGGEYTKSDFNPISPHEDVKTNLLNSVEASDLRDYEKLNTQNALRKIWGDNPDKPATHDIEYIRRYFNSIDQGAGDEVGTALEQAIKESPNSWRDGMASRLAGTPRALMATMDLSGLGRQGAPLGTRFPKEWAIASKESVKFAGSQKYFDNKMQGIRDDKDYAFMTDKMNLQLTGADKSVEEKFAGADYAEAIPVAGRGVKASNRAYTGGLTYQRYLVGKNIVEAHGGQDQMMKYYQEKFGDKADNALNVLGEVINTLSGRGGKKGGLIERHMKTLETTLFAPRLWASTFNRLNPVWYARLYKANPAAAKLAIQGESAFLATAGTVLALAATAGATVVMDPRSADFAKVKFGNTRFDILGGQQQNFRLLAQEWTGQKINSVTGEIQTLGADRGFGKPSRYDIALQAFENKENPLISFATKILKGTDQQGQPVNKGAEALGLIVPLNIQSGYEAAKDTGSAAKGAALSIPGFFGAGVQTYGANPTKDQGPNGEFRGKVTPDMVTNADGKPILDDKGKPVKVKFPADATDIQKKALLDEKRTSALKAQYVRGLSKDDQALMKLTDEQLKRYVKDGTIDQSRFDHIKNIQKTADSQASGNNYKIPDGVKTTNAQSFYKKWNSMNQKDQKWWLEKGKPEQFTKDMTAQLNKTRVPGLSEFKPSNGLAKAYSEYEKDLNNHPEYTDIDKRNKVKEFQKFVYKLNYNNNQRDLFAEGGSSDTRYLVDQRKISKEDLDQAIKMDNELYDSGLTGTLKFSKKFRKDFGYGVPNGFGAGGPGTGSSGGDKVAAFNAHLDALVPNSKGNSTGDKPEFSKKPRTTLSFKNVNLPTGSGKKKISIKL